MHMHTHENEIRAGVGVHASALQRGRSGLADTDVGAGMAVAGTPAAGHG